MLRPGSTYIRGGSRRQFARLASIAAAGVMSMALGGCAGLGLPFDPASNYMESDASATPVAASAVVVNDRVDPSDWETVRTTLADAPSGAVDGLDWLNSDTGSTGTVAVAAAVDKDGASCRAFSMTINDVRGVRRYRGETCTGPDGNWQLKSVTADDAAIS